MKKKCINPYLNWKSAVYAGWFIAVLLFAGLGLYEVTVEKENTYIRSLIRSAESDIALVGQEIRALDSRIESGSCLVALEERLEGSGDKSLATVAVENTERLIRVGHGEAAGRLATVSFQE